MELIKMTIPFSAIPRHLQISIAEKFDICDYLQFHTCSRVSFEVSKKIKPFLISSKVVQIINSVTGVLFCGPFGSRNHHKPISFKHLACAPFRISAEKIYIDGVLTDKFLSWIISFTQATKPSFSILATLSIKNISKEVFGSLLETLKVETLVVHGSIDPILLSASNMKNITSLNAECFLDDDGLISLTIPRMVLRETRIRSLGINRLLREWMKGERTISFIRIQTMHEFKRKVVFDGISGAVHNISNGEFMTNAIGQGLYITIDDHLVELRNSQFPLL